MWIHPGGIFGRQKAAQAYKIHVSRSLWKTVYHRDQDDFQESGDPETISVEEKDQKTKNNRQLLDPIPDKWK